MQDPQELIDWLQAQPRGAKIGIKHGAIMVTDSNECFGLPDFQESPRLGILAKVTVVPDVDEWDFNDEESARDAMAKQVAMDIKGGMVGCSIVKIPVDVPNLSKPENPGNYCANG